MYIKRLRYIDVIRGSRQKCARYGALATRAPSYSVPISSFRVTEECRLLHRENCIRFSENYGADHRGCNVPRPWKRSATTLPLVYANRCCPNKSDRRN